MIEVTLNGLGMNTGVPDPDGSLWYVTEWDGWDAPDLRQSTIDPSLTDGTLVTESLYGGRTISLTGQCKATSEANFWKSWNKIASLVSTYVPSPLVVTEDVQKQCAVVMTGSPPKLAITGVGHFEWNLQVLANDPRKYAVTESSVSVGSGATVSVINGGTTSTFPLISASGVTDIDNITANLRFKTTTALLSSSVIDMRRRSVYSADTNQISKVSPFGSWWALLPGVNSIKNYGAASVTIKYRNAWI